MKIYFTGAIGVRLLYRDEVRRMAAPYKFYKVRKEFTKCAAVRPDSSLQPPKGLYHKLLTTKIDFMIGGNFSV